MSTRLDLSKLNLMDALDLAILIEMEAYERYKIFASQLGRTGGYDPAAFFASMAENEAKHGKQLLMRRKALFGNSPMRVSRDDLSDVEDGEVSETEAMGLRAWIQANPEVASLPQVDRIVETHGPLLRELGYLRRDGKVAA